MKINDIHKCLTEFNMNVKYVNTFGGIRKSSYICGVKK